MTHHGRQKTLRIDAATGSYTTPIKTLKLVLHGDPDVRKIIVNGSPVEAHNRKSSFFVPLERYDPINEPDSMGEENVVEAIFPYSSEAIKITW
jgi:hypothetical protein